MSGGIPDDDDNDGKHNNSNTTRQMTFTIVGKLNAEQKKAWNDRIKELKTIFGKQLHAVSMLGVDTPSTQVKKKPR
jgi:hypothetical protein